MLIESNFEPGDKVQHVLTEDVGIIDGICYESTEFYYYLVTWKGGVSRTKEEEIQEYDG